MTSRALELLADADRQARDLLLDSYGVDSGFGMRPRLGSCDAFGSHRVEHDPCHGGLASQ